jgi:hypothetical protein
MRDRAIKCRRNTVEIEAPMLVSDAQSDIRRGSLSGAPGILASSLAWFVAAFVAWQISPQHAVWALFVGGMLIHPVGLLIATAMGSRGDFTKGNPLGGLAFANTAWLIFSLPLAYAVSLQHIEWFFPAMLLIIGGRYLTFATLFGMRLYWALGLALAGIGFWSGIRLVDPAVVALAGAATELAFAALAFALHARWIKAQA